MFPRAFYLLASLLARNLLICVGATEPGYVALTLHRHGNKIMALDRSRVQEIKIFKLQHGERGDKGVDKGLAITTKQAKKRAKGKEGE